MSACVCTQGEGDPVLLPLARRVSPPPGDACSDATGPVDAAGGTDQNDASPNKRPTMTSRAGSASGGGDVRKLARHQRANARKTPVTHCRPLQKARRPPHRYARGKRSAVIGCGSRSTEALPAPRGKLRTSPGHTRALFGGSRRCGGARASVPTCRLAVRRRDEGCHPATGSSPGF